MKAEKTVVISARTVKMRAVVVLIKSIINPTKKQS